MKTVSNEPSLLLIDDSEEDIELIKRILEGSVDAKDIHSAGDGEEALRMLQKRDHSTSDLNIGVVVLDLNLPGMSGYEVLKEIKSDERTRGVPVIVFTGSNAERDIRKAYELGANSYVVKPSMFDDLTRTVKSIDQFWLKTAALPSRNSVRRVGGPE